MKKSISSLISRIIPIATVIVLVFNPFSRVIYGAFGWSVETQILVFFPIMLVLAVVTVVLEEQKERGSDSKYDFSNDVHGIGTDRLEDEHDQII